MVGLYAGQQKPGWTEGDREYGDGHARYVLAESKDTL